MSFKLLEGLPLIILLMEVNPLNNNFFNILGYIMILGSIILNIIIFF